MAAQLLQARQRLPKGDAPNGLFVGAGARLHRQALVAARLLTG